MFKGFLCSACHIQLYSSFLFSSAFGSLLLLCQRNSNVRWKQNTVKAYNKEFFIKPYKIVCYCMALVTCRQSTSFVSGWSLKSEADILIQSAANSNNSLSLLKLTHLTSVIQLRAELHWPSCCDYMCLHGREVFTVETATPSCCSFSYWRKGASVRFHLFIIYGREL